MLHFGEKTPILQKSNFKSLGPNRPRSACKIFCCMFQKCCSMSDFDRSRLLCKKKISFFSKVFEISGRKPCFLAKKVRRQRRIKEFL